MNRRGSLFVSFAFGLLVVLPLVAGGCDKARNDSISLANHGVRAYADGEHETASHYFSRAIEVFPQNDLAHYHLGLVQRYDHGDLEAARKSFTEAHRLNPHNPDACFQLATMFFDEGKWDKAQTFINRTIQADPQNHQAHFQLGRILATKQKHAEADAEYRRAITLYPLYPPAFNALAVLYMGFDQLDAAVSVLWEGIRLNPDDVELNGNLGLALMEAEDWEGARDAFERALSIEPEEAIYLFNLGIVFERLGNTDRAIQLLDAFVERSAPEQATEATLARAVVDMVLRARDARKRARHVELPEPPPPTPPEGAEGAENGSEGAADSPTGAGDGP